MQEFISPLRELVASVRACSGELGRRAAADPDEVGAASVAYLRVLGHLVYAWLWARMARIAIDHEGDRGFYAGKLATARFYFARLLPEAQAQLHAARSGAGNLMALAPELF